MSWLDSILSRGRWLRARECGSQLPENPTIADFKIEAFRIGQLAKELQNSGHHWSDAQWREISKWIERLENK
jgi:hypothetical protein